MEYIYKEVNFSKYCPLCEYADLYEEKDPWTDKIFMFLSLEAIACGLISGVYILVGGTNGIHI